MADEDSVWTPHVQRKDHPFGEPGVIASLEAVAERVALGATSPKVRMWAIECLDRARTERGWKMDTEKERAIVLLEACQKKLWVPDPIGFEWMAGAHLMACDPDKDGVCFRGNDCFPVGTLLLGEGHELVPVESVKPGSKIWGLDRWSTVEAVAYKGILPIDVITLNNGSEVKLTADHHVYVLDCQKHPMLDDGVEARTLPEDRHWRGGGADDRRWGCSCDAEHRVEKRCRVLELREGMVMPTPDRIPFGTETMDPDRAYIEGLYVSDGYATKSGSSFYISGKDGAPKEQQKREVQEGCERLGVNTSWKHDRIHVLDREWSLRCHLMGRRAPNKHLLSINLDEGAAAPTLRGVMADSGANTRGPSRTFTTTSRELAIQTRLLHKMFGVQCGWRYIENHGGLGENPIYRLGQRGRETTAAGRKPWMLKVKKIEREVLAVPCWDIQTDDHRVYLAEHDVTVSNCDDLVVLLGSCFSGVGLYTAVVGHAYDREKNISHVLTSVWVNGRWMYADPSTDLPLGECVKFTRERVYSVPNIKMICDSNVCFTHPQRFDPDKNDFVGKGGFVGVSGVPKFAWLSEPKRNVQWLGGVEEAGRQFATRKLSDQCDHLSSECAKRVCGKIVEKQGGTSKEDLKEYTTTAAVCGAEGACTYFGVPPGPATNLCGSIGGAVGKVFFEGTAFVINKIGNLLGLRNNKAKKFKKRVEIVNETFSEFSEWIEDIYQDQEEATQLLHDLIEKNLELYNQESPDHNLTKIDLAMKLQQFGLPMATQWRPLLGFSVGITNGGSVLSEIPTSRDQAWADQLNDRFDMIMSPEWDAELGLYIADRLKWTHMPSKDAKRLVEAEYENVANRYNTIHDQIVGWLVQLEVAGAMLTAYVAEAAAKNKAAKDIQEAMERINFVPNMPVNSWPTCKTAAEAGTAYNCIRDTSLAECKGAPRNFFEFVDALPYCDSVTQAEKDLLAVAEALADTKKKKKSSPLPVIVFGLAAAGAAWWLL